MMALTVKSFDPAVGDDEQTVRQVFGQDAVLGRRVGCRTETDHGIGQQGVHLPVHHRAADDLDGIADEHHPPLRHRVGKSADEGGEDHVRDRKKSLQQRLVFTRRLHVAQQGDGYNEQDIVGQRGKKLRGHDDVEAEGH
jgi:hypothetical protein